VSRGLSEAHDGGIIYDGKACPVLENMPPYSKYGNELANM
jgi:hypothetical protein